MNVKLIMKQQQEQLLKNGEAQRKARQENKEIDFKPVVKLFTPDAQCTWLLSEIYPDDPDVAFGLCDLGMQCPELGDVWISEFTQLHSTNNLPVERDRFFEPTKTLGEYARDAQKAQRISC